MEMSLTANLAYESEIPGSPQASNSLEVRSCSFSFGRKSFHCFSCDKVLVSCRSPSFKMQLPVWI